MDADVARAPVHGGMVGMVLLFVLCLLSAVASAQSLHSAVQCPARIGGVQGVVTVVGSELTWCVSGVNQTAQLPFIDVVCGAPIGDEFVACGRDSAGGSVMVSVSTHRGSLRVRRDRHYRDLKIRGLLFDERNEDLFLLEEERGYVFCVQPDRLPPLRSEDAIATIPGAWRRAWVDRTNGGLCVGVPGYHTRLYRDGQQWARQSAKGADGEVPLIAVTVAPSVVGPVEVQLGRTGDLSLEDEAGARVALGVGQAGRHAYRLPTALDAFGRYRAVLGHSGQEDTPIFSDWVIPRIRLGNVATRGLLRGTRIDGNAEHCYVGSGFFITNSRVTVPSVPSDAEVYVWTQTVPRGHEVAVVQRGSITWLAPANGLRVPVRPTKVGDTDIGVPILIPNEQALIGSVLYMQSCVVGLSDAVVSDICGIGIQARERGGLRIAPPSAALRDFTARHAVDRSVVEAMVERVSRLP